MKVILSTLNSKFIHSNLAIRYLKEHTKDLIDIDIKEYTINQNTGYIASDLYKEKPDVIGFSTYIWNFTETMEICETLKIVNPNIKIILGGPEVSFDMENVMTNNKFVDFIVYGEGEDTFKELMKSIIDNESYNHIEGLAYLEDEEIKINKPRELIKNLNKIPSPYGNIGEFENKIVYFESSRGCPFNCAFCLSSTIKGVRYFTVDRVKEELGHLIEGKVGQVKFVDRTFNANKKYAMEIMNFIIDKNPENINFHFEVTAHLLDEEMLVFLSTVKEGLFQFEVGVQSTNEKTIEAIGRTTDFPKLKEITKRIKTYRNIHQHLDLIAGLPYEDYESFGRSFNDVYEIKPEKIQLGFLKLLKGSKLRADEGKYGIKYLNTAPYEILENDFLSYEEMMKLKLIEEIVEKYYNEEYFKHSIEFIIKNHYKNPFDFYEEFANYWDIKEHLKVSNSRVRLYEIFMEFYNFKNFDFKDIFIELLKFDFVKNNKGNRIPELINKISLKIDQKHIHEILKNEEMMKNQLVGYKDIPTKKLLKDIAIESFRVNVFSVIENGYNPMEKEIVQILFIYEKGIINRCKTYNITKLIEEMV